MENTKLSAALEEAWQSLHSRWTRTTAQEYYDLYHRELVDCAEELEKQCSQFKQMTEELTRTMNSIEMHLDT